MPTQAASTTRYATTSAADPFNLVRIRGRGGAVALQVDWASFARPASSSARAQAVADVVAVAATAPAAAPPPPRDDANSWIRDYLAAHEKHAAPPA